MKNWIADETERQQMIVGEEEYFIEFDIEDMPCDIYSCCEYAEWHKVALKKNIIEPH